MMLSGTYGRANIIMLVNSLMLYNTKEMCVFVPIYLKAVHFCTYNVAIIVYAVILRTM